MLLTPELFLALECVPALDETSFLDMLPKGNFGLYRFLKEIALDIHMYACDTYEFSIVPPRENFLTPDTAHRIVSATLAGNEGGQRLVERLAVKPDVRFHQRFGLWKFYNSVGSKISFTRAAGTLYEVSLSLQMRTFVIATCHLHAAHIAALRWYAPEPITLTVQAVRRMSIYRSEML